MYHGRNREDSNSFLLLYIGYWRLLLLFRNSVGPYGIYWPVLLKTFSVHINNSLSEILIVQSQHKYNFGNTVMNSMNSKVHLLPRLIFRI